MNFSHGSIDTGTKFPDEFFWLFCYFFCRHITFLHFVYLIIQVELILELDLIISWIFIWIYYFLPLLRVCVLFFTFIVDFKGSLFHISFKSRLTFRYILKLILFSFDVLFVHLIHLIEFLNPESELLTLFGLIFFNFFDIFGMIALERGFELQQMALKVKFGLLEKGLGFEELVFEGSILVLELYFLLFVLIFKFADFLAVLESNLTVLFLKFLLSGLSVVLILLVVLKNGLIKFVQFGLFLLVLMKFLLKKVNLLFEKRTLAWWQHMAWQHTVRFIIFYRYFS